MPGSPGHDLELRARAVADPDRLALVDLAVRAAAAAPAPVTTVHAGPDVTLVLAHPLPCRHPGFADHDGGRGWRVTGDHAAFRSAATAPPVPLVTVGRDGASEVLVNLAAGTPVSVTGSGSPARDLLWSMAVELATAPWRPARLVLVGFGGELRTLEHVEVAETLEEVMAELQAEAAAPAQPGVTTVVLAAGAGQPQHAQTLCSLAAPGSPLVAVIAGSERYGTWEIEVDREHVSIAALGMWVPRLAVGTDARAALEDVLVAAHDVAGVEAEPSPGRRRSDLAAETTPALDVRVLGPVEVVGCAEEFRRRKPLELVAHLAVHRQGVDADTLAEALWPDRPSNPATLHTMASIARRCLGPDTSGRPHLPHVGSDGRYRLGPEVGLDLDRFRAHVARAAALEDGAGASELRAALELVRGRPFTTPGEDYLWAHAEALATSVVAEVADTAHRLAEMYLEAGDARGAWWATQQGLLASPGNEQLHRDRMRAADLIGNPAGVEEVMAELCRAIEVDASEAADVLHPSTLELYRRLRRRPRRLAIRS